MRITKNEHGEFVISEVYVIASGERVIRNRVLKKDGSIKTFEEYPDRKPEVLKKEWREFQYR